MKRNEYISSCIRSISLLNASSESKSSFGIENGLIRHDVAFVDFENENYGIILQLIKTSIYRIEF